MRRFFRKFWLFSYRLLPTFFILMSVYNVWLRFRRVEDVSIKIRAEHAAFVAQVTNLLVSASSDFSNQVKRVRSLLYQYTYVSNGVSRIDSLSSPVSPFSRPSTNYVDLVDVEGRYFVSEGVPSIDINGFYYTVGDDFGYGEIKMLSSLVVLTDRYRIRLKASSRSLPSQVAHNEVLFAPIIDDTYPLPDLESYLERGNSVSTRLNENLNRRYNNDTSRNR